MTQETRAIWYVSVLSSYAMTGVNYYSQSRYRAAARTKRSLEQLCSKNSTSFSSPLCNWNIMTREQLLTLGIKGWSDKINFTKGIKWSALENKNSKVVFSLVLVLTRGKVMWLSFRWQFIACLLLLLTQITITLKTNQSAVTDSISLLALHTSQWHFKL